MAIPVAAKYISDFEKLGFGMFVHWGIYSQLGMGEWTYLIHKRKMEDYKKLADTFTAEDFDAEELVLTAKRAGCKYITLTTRHHDGFSLYDTCGLSDFDAPHSAAKRDLIREFVDACNKYDIVPFLYHTTLDWYNKDFEENFDAYLEYLRKSVEILCKNYGKIGGLWFDGNWSKKDADWKEDELYATIRKYQPEAIIVNNTGLRALGAVGHPELDVVTYERGNPTPLNREGMPKYVAAEVCHTINAHWAYGSCDFDFKSPKDLIENLCGCRRVGANYLLNIGPTEQGAIQPIQRELLNIVGKWVDIFGEAIYDVKPYPAVGMGGKNFIVKGDGYLYLFFHDLARTGNENVTKPARGGYCGTYAFGNVTDQVESIQWIDSNEELTFAQNGEMLTIYATGYPYGMAACVRVARAKLK